MPAARPASRGSARKRPGQACRLLWPLVLLAACAAHAQTPSPLAEWQYSAGVPLEKMFEPETAQWGIRLGAGAIMRPMYDGASRYHMLAGPSIDIRYRDLLFLSTGEGLGINLVSTPHWRAGIALSYDLGRRSEDDPGHLHGLPNLNPAPEAKLFAEYVVSKSFPLVLRVDARRTLAPDDGWTADIGAYLPLPGSSETFYWFAGPTVTLADSRYMARRFGIDAAQAASSGYAPYSPGGGIKSAGFGVSTVYYLNKHWFATADVALSRLLGAAANSPLAANPLGLAIDASLNYEF
ncbi:MipA/OmpV family protein [Cupriavidus sp. USMAA2-4]|uniref:MipA/OmpV family protein n=1 Tax=Cupriavidus sp. USMAA2-4 TaxID=876364 RepID=UPI000A05E1D8|nr:MipA/OmpV family protein [Cupriavidus sp. USMAA2-4]